MAYKDRFNNNNKHHDNNATEVVTTSDATSEETLVIEAENNTEEVIDDATVLDVQPVEEKKEELKMTEPIIEKNDKEANSNKAKIEELNNKIKAWEADLIRSKNNILNATLHDSIMAAKKEIRDLSSQLPPITTTEVKVNKPASRGLSPKALESLDDHIIRII